MKRLARCLLHVSLVLTAATPLSADPTPLVVLDFEKPLPVETWPPDSPSRIEFVSDWQADGTQSLRIGPQLMASLGTLQASDWRGYPLLRVHFHNPGTETIAVGFELQDEHTQYHERHQNSFGAPPGSHIVDVDISGDLWRGEENRSYRGLVKTPINIGRITRLSFYNHGEGPLYIDAVQLVQQPRPEVPGAFAFDFGNIGTPVPYPWTGIDNETGYDAELGYGLLSGAQGLSRNMSFPTPVLGDGLAWNSEGFRVDLPAGPYRGWIAFERGGFWEDQAAGYTMAELRVDGREVHTHTYQPEGAHFQFQDTEVTDFEDLGRLLIWPAHAVGQFDFTADGDGSLFQLTTRGTTGLPLRIAGLILAPASPAGEKFIDHHVTGQQQILARTFAAQDRGRRADAGRRAPAAPLVLEPLLPGAMVYPGDWPARTGSAVTPSPAVELTGIAGQVLTVHVGVYAREPMSVTVSTPAAADLTLSSPARIAHGRYLPMRPYGTGVAWLEVNHYRPGAQMTVGPQLARSVIVELPIDPSTPAGLYTTGISVTGQDQVAHLSLRVQVVALELPPVPLPVGLFMNALPFGPEAVGAARWWQLQEQLLTEQLGAGLNVITGGAALDYELAVNDVGSVRLIGEAPRRYLRTAQQLGSVHAVVPYGGFLSRLPNLNAAPESLAVALDRLTTNEGLPLHYVYAYDEPSTVSELGPVVEQLEATVGSGLPTIGYTSWHEDEPLWWRLLRASYAPAFNVHRAEHLQQVRDEGLEPWVYNNGKGRLGFGLRLWRSWKLGAAGRLEWIGLFTQGFAFHNLDGREPSRSCFLVHRDLGILMTPMWLANRAGLMDLRIRLALEAAVPAGDPSLDLWPLEGYREDEEEWSPARLDSVRQAMLRRLIELPGGTR